MEINVRTRCIYAKYVRKYLPYHCFVSSYFLYFPTNFHRAFFHTRARDRRAVALNVINARACCSALVASMEFLAPFAFWLNGFAIAILFARLSSVLSADSIICYSLTRASISEIMCHSLSSWSQAHVTRSCDPRDEHRHATRDSNILQDMCLSKRAWNAWFILNIRTLARLRHLSLMIFVLQDKCLVIVTWCHVTRG